VDEGEDDGDIVMDSENESGSESGSQIEIEDE